MTRAGEERLTVAFVNLHARTDNWPHMVMVPQGVMYLSAVLKRAFGDRVSVVMHDMTLSPRDESLERSVEDFLRAHRPDIVGIRGFTCQAAEFPVVARIAKDVAPDCLVVAGGPHASTRSMTLFREPAIDLVVPLEGETTLVELVANVLAGIDPRTTPGTAWLDGDHAAFAPPRPLIQDLDAIPFPDYSILDLDRYQGPCTMTGLPPRGRYTSIFTSRGCHYHCAYCHDNFGKQVRWRSVDNVIDEIRQLVEEHGVDELQIIDDIFNADEKRAIEIFDRISRNGWKLHLAFPNGLRGDVMHEEFVAAAAAAGAYYWGIAVETASPRLQKLVKKHNRLDRVREAISLSARYGVLTASFNMLGFPTETEAEMEETIRFNVEGDAHIVWFFLVMPFEGTTLHEIVQQHDLVVPSPGENSVLGFSNYTEDGNAWFTSLARPEIQQKIVDAYRRIYFDPRRMARFEALPARGHDLAQLRHFLENRLRATALTVDTVPDPQARASIERLFAMADRVAIKT